MERLAIIAALTVSPGDDRVIGYKQQLPWHLPKDLQFFKTTTTGAYVLMGRHTFAALGRPLPERKNIVITSMPEKLAPGDYRACPTPAAALAMCPPGVNIFVIGGAQVYREYLPQCGKMYLTEIAAKVPGDAFFPKFDPAAWSKKVTCRTEEIINHRPVQVNYCEYTRR